MVRSYEKAVIFPN